MYPRVCSRALATNVWRWGNTSAGNPLSKNFPELSKTPNRLEGVGSSSSLVACGWNHSAVVNTDGSLHTYGENKEKQLGHENGEKGQVGQVDLTYVAQIALGGYHSAAVTRSGDLYTWGWGGSFWSGSGALGSGTQDTHPVPLRIPLPDKVYQVACAKQHSLVLLQNGTVLSSGKGDYGRLGRGDTSDDLYFSPIEYFLGIRDSILEATGGVSAIKKVDCGAHFSVALTEAGELFVWGRNDQGQLGLGDDSMGDIHSTERYPRLLRSFPMEGLKVVDFACGDHHVTALTNHGALYTWGDNAWLQPNRVSLPSNYENSIKDVMKIACGSKVSFALTANGYLYAWGKKSSGCIAENAVTPVRLDPKLFGSQKVIDIATGKNRCLAITSAEEFQPEA
eukprot:GEMP01050625.1.p1 GENE.GEMP01050625.1~~GEMP01050625.1.p1  ORF type:complete len:394 (+),score=63.36 GEMP01050625.1:35-1216(+)